MNKFNTADRVLCIVFVLFLIFLGLRIVFPHNLFLEFLLFCAEAALVGGIADWFAVTALFKKPLGFPFHTAILPRRRTQFINSCIKMLQTEFLSKKKIYKRICNADLLSKGLIWLRQPENKKYLVRTIMQFIVEKIRKLDLKAIAHNNCSKLSTTVMNESMSELSSKLIDVLTTTQNSQMAVDKGVSLLRNYFTDEDGEKRILNFIEAYQRQYTKGGVSSFMLSIALATNTLDPEELAQIIHRRLLKILEEASQKDSELYSSLVDLYNNLLHQIHENEEWTNSLNNLRDNFVTSGTLEKILYNSIKNFCDYLLSNSDESNKLHLAIEEIFSTEIDNCIDKLNTNNEFKAKINRFIMDVLHRTALKGEDVILELARKFLEGLSDKQLNELVYGKVETDMIWIRLNGSIVGGTIGAVAFWILQLTH